MVASACSPMVGRKDGSCYSDDALRRMAASLGDKGGSAAEKEGEEEDVKEKAAKEADEAAIAPGERKTLWTRLRAAMGDECANEACWAKKLGMTDLLGYFAPAAPAEWKKNPHEWLTDADIDKVMAQYTQKYKCFTYLGTVPMDFDKRQASSCITPSMCGFSLADQLRQGKTKIGCVLNTDDHDQGGSHWVALYIDARPPPHRAVLYYFDSVGDEMTPEVRAFALRVQQQAQQIGRPLDIDQNHPVKHQHTTYSCGMYALYFIIHMLEDRITGEYLKTHKLNDTDIERLRKIYFNWTD